MKKYKRRLELNPFFILDNLTSKIVKNQLNRIHRPHELFEVQNLSLFNKWILKAIRSFNKWNLERCYHCSCTETYSDNFDYINHMVCEYTVKCKNCHATINAYAYGNFQEPTTRLGQYGMELHYLVGELKNKLKKNK